MKDALKTLLINSLIGYLIFVFIGFCVVTCVDWWGYWPGILIGSAIPLITLYAIKAVQVLSQRRRESLSYLLRQYGERVAANARKRKD
jgi:hypothetical protein